MTRRSNLGLRKARTRKSQGSRRAQLTGAFLKALRRKESLLPKHVLEGHVRRLLNHREVLLESAAGFGTPQYFFDEASLQDRIRRFKAAFSRHIETCRVFYAMKSNSFEGVCRRAVLEGLGLDVSSGLELSRALALGCRAIVFSGPGKTEAELALAYENRRWVTLLLDSSGELDRLMGIIERRAAGADPLRVGVRVAQGDGWHKFGVPLKRLGAVLKKAAAGRDIVLRGVQFHTSWNLDPNAQIRMIEDIGAFISREAPPGLRQSLRFLDIGGGFWPEQGEWLNPQHTKRGKIILGLDPSSRFPMKHYRREAVPLEHFSRAIAGALSSQGPPLDRLEVWTEPGRWISNESMHILLKVIDKKGARTVITDGGTNLLGWERPLSEFIPVINLTRPSLRERPTQVFGSLCTPLDTWGTSVFGDGAEPGDILLIPDQGAYTYSLRQAFIKPVAGVVGYGEAGLKVLS